MHPYLTGLSILLVIVLAGGCEPPKVPHRHRAAAGTGAPPPPPQLVVLDQPDRKDEVFAKTGEESQRPAADEASGMTRDSGGLPGLPQQGMQVAGAPFPGAPGPDIPVDATAGGGSDLVPSTPLDPSALPTKGRGPVGHRALGGETAARTSPGDSETAEASVSSPVASPVLPAERLSLHGLEGPEAPGGPSVPPAIDVVLRRQESGLQRCFEAFVLRQPGTASGSINVRLAISPVGSVDRADVVGGTIDDAEFNRCILERVRGWSFPRGDAATVVTRAFSFGGPSPEAPALP